MNQKTSEFIDAFIEDASDDFTTEALFYPNHIITKIDKGVNFNNFDISIEYKDEFYHIGDAIEDGMNNIMIIHEDKYLKDKISAFNNTFTTILKICLKRYYIKTFTINKKAFVEECHQCSYFKNAVCFFGYADLIRLCEDYYGMEFENINHDEIMVDNPRFVVPLECPSKLEHIVLNAI